MEIQMEIKTITCRVCQVEKSLDCYRIKNRTCKQCRSIKYNAKLRDNNFYRDYYQANREELIKRANELYHTKYKIERAQKKALLQEQQEQQEQQEEDHVN
jgi:hypothetical protein